MGSSNSKSDSKVQHETNFSKLKSRFNLPHDYITVDKWNEIFTNGDNSFTDFVWSFYCDANGLFSEYNFDDLCYQISVDKLLRFLCSIVRKDGPFTLDGMRLLIKWLLHGDSIAADIVLTSYMSTQNVYDGSLNEDHFVNWMERNLPDIVVDFSRFFSRILSSDPTILSDLLTDYLHSVKLKRTTTLNCSLLLLLLYTLPYSYKSEVGYKFLMQQIHSWNVVYNSDQDGLSASKFKERSFDLDGSVLVVMKVESGIYCLASDMGLKENFRAYGNADSRFYQLFPIFKRIVSASASDNNGIIYSHFTAKSGKRGFFIGHNPMKSAAIEIDEDFAKISVLGKLEQLQTVETWAVGNEVEERLKKLRQLRNWEQKEVSKEQNRRIKSDDWFDNPDREILSLGGVNVRNTDLIGGDDRKK